MLTLAQSFLLQPKLLLIDELSLGLAPAIVRELLQAVRDVNATGAAIVLVEQSVNVALTLADRAYFMEKGEVRFSGPTTELLTRSDLLRSVFLEGAHAAVGAQVTRLLACVEVGGSSSQTVVFGDDTVVLLDGTHQPAGARLALAVPGLLDGHRVVGASNLGWIDVDPVEELGLRGPAEVVCNDAEAAALGEAELRGPARGARLRRARHRYRRRRGAAATTGHRRQPVRSRPLLRRQPVPVRTARLP